MIVVYVILGTLIILMTITFIYLFVNEKHKKESVIDHVKDFAQYNSDVSLFQAAKKTLDNRGIETDDEKIVNKANEKEVLTSFKNLNSLFINNIVNRE